MFKLTLLLLPVLLAMPTAAQTQSKTPFVHLDLVWDSTDRNSQTVVPILRQELVQSGLFDIMSPDDSKVNLVIVADCYRDTSNDPYSCYYVANLAGPSHKTLLGGAIVVQATAQKAADAMLSSVTADISERWNSTNRSNLIETLEDCLFLTESSCAVPDLLVAELHTKTINLSQYLRSGLKK